MRADGDALPARRRPQGSMKRNPDAPPPPIVPVAQHGRWHAHRTIARSSLGTAIVTVPRGRALLRCEFMNLELTLLVAVPLFPAESGSRRWVGGGSRDAVSARPDPREIV